MKYLKIFKAFENLNSDLTYELIEDTIKSYEDEGEIKIQKIEVWTPLSKKNNLYYFITGFEYCLMSDGQFQKDPFDFVNYETDLDDYFKAKSEKGNSNKEGFYFKVVLNRKFAENFKPSFLEEMGLDHYNLLYKECVGAFDLVNKRKMVFEMCQEIFSMFQSIYGEEYKPNIFYRVNQTYTLSKEGSPADKFAVLHFKIEV
jgi:hypothetical protein